MKIRPLPAVLPAAPSDHALLSLPPAAAAEAPAGLPWALRLAAGFAVLGLLTISVLLLHRLFSLHPGEAALEQVLATLNSRAFWTAAAVGLFAQIIDGALGMAYGLTATSFLLGTGVSPAVATASVHMAEVFTTGFSGLSHLRFGNVDRQLFLRLLLPGLAGALLGAVVVTQVDGDLMKPVVTLYLLGMGLHLLRKAFLTRVAPALSPQRVAPVALVGGFVDAAGGGGWGPVVTSSLLGVGANPRTTIGSVNFAEFFLTLSSAAAFAFLVGTAAWPTIAGLVFGGLFAAPFAALLCRRLSARTLLRVVGVLITGISLYGLWSLV